MGVAVLLQLCLLIYHVYSQAYDASTSLNCCPQSPAILSCFNGEFNITATPQTKVYWFQLDLNQDQSVEFSTCNSDFDTQTEVWTPSKSLISTPYCSPGAYDNDDCGGCGENELYTIPDMQPGTYYIYVGWIRHITDYTGSPVGPTQALSIETTGCISSPPTTSKPTTLTLMPTTSMPTTQSLTTQVPTTKSPTTTTPTSHPTTSMPTTNIPTGGPSTSQPTGSVSSSTTFIATTTAVAVDGNHNSEETQSFTILIWMIASIGSFIIIIICIICFIVISKCKKKIKKKKQIRLNIMENIQLTNTQNDENNAVSVDNPVSKDSNIKNQDDKGESSHSDGMYENGFSENVTAGDRNKGKVEGRRSSDSEAMYKEQSVHITNDETMTGTLCMEDNENHNIGNNHDNTYNATTRDIDQHAIYHNTESGDV